MLQNYATIPLYITHKNVTFCHEGTGVQKGFLIATCLLACSLFKHPLLSIVCAEHELANFRPQTLTQKRRFFSSHKGSEQLSYQALPKSFQQYSSILS